MKIKPRIKEDTPKPRPHFGSNGVTSRSGGKRKTNCICPNYKCSYSSRNWIVEWDKHINQVESNSSKHCPIHQLPLIDVGYASPVPKAGTKERQELIKRYLK